MPKRRERGKDMTIVFGRFNPPTIGHKLVLDRLSSLPGDLCGLSFEIE